MSRKGPRMALESALGLLILAGSISPAAEPISINQNRETASHFIPNPADESIVSILREQFASIAGSEKMIDKELIYQTFDLNTTRMSVQVILEEGTSSTRSPINWNSEAWRNENRARIGSLQREIIDDIPATSMAVDAQYHNFPAFAAFVDAEGLSMLLADPRVKHVEPTRFARKYDVQGLNVMDGVAARASYPGTGLTIAIIDDGVDYTHTFLGGGGFPNTKVIGGYDFEAEDSDPRNPTASHGTACSGIAGGASGTVGDYNGGIAMGAKIAALKVFPNGGGGASFTDINEALDWCVDNQNISPGNPIMVASMSLGGGGFSSACDASLPSTLGFVNACVSAGITVLAASGNDAFCNAIGAPACLSPVISVGAVYDANIGAAAFCGDATTCFGFTFATGSCPSGLAVQDNTTAAKKVTCYSNSANILTLLAPSHNAYTLDVVGASGYSSGDYTTDFGGTSAACPYAAGAVAVLQHANKTVQGVYLTPAAVKSKLTSTGESINDTKDGGMAARTTPLIDLAAAVATIDPNDNPTDIGLTATTVAENLAANTVIGTLSATDPDAGQSFTYSLLSGGGNFNISGSQLRTSAGFNYETASSYNIQIQVQDNGSPTGSYSEFFTINVSDVNEPPTLVGITSTNIAENAGVDAVIGTLSTTDPETLQSHTYSMQVGGTNFNVFGNSLRANASLNYEGTNSYNITVRSTDNGTPTQFFDQNFTITVTNVNESPTLVSLTSNSVSENQGANTVVGTLSSTDPEGAQSHTYSLQSGSGDFNINGNELRTNSVFNFESASSYSITVRSMDNGAPSQFRDENFTVNVTNVNDPPVVDGSATFDATVAYFSTTVLTTAMINVTDEDHAPSSIAMVIDTAVGSGILENTNARSVLGSGNSFTMADVIAGSIQYTHTTALPPFDQFSVIYNDGISPPVAPVFFTFNFIPGSSVDDWALLEE